MSGKRSYTRWAQGPPRCARREREREKADLVHQGLIARSAVFAQFPGGLMHPSVFLQSVRGYLRSRRGCRWSLAPRHCHSSRPALGHDCSNLSTLTSKHSKETRVYLVVSARTRTSNSSTTRHLFFEKPIRTNSPASVQAALHSDVN